MKAVRTFGLAFAVLAIAGIVRAGELKSGPQVGEDVGAFEVTKVAGAPNDDVPAGEELCYRCKLGNRPVVMVFARKSDEQLANLVKELDKVVAKNTDKKMGSFVNLLGDDMAALKSEAKKLAEKSKPENVAVVIPADHKEGPSNYSINPDADVTVLIYKGGKVEANHALPTGKLSKTEVAKIIEDTSKILK
jgi:hypothetical protein